MSQFSAGARLREAMRTEQPLQMPGVINADKVRFTGGKWDQKEYLTYSGYPGGQKATVAKDLLDKKPFAIIENGVKGMLPKTKLGRAMIKKLFIYEGAEHPHQAQKPEPFNF